MIPMAIFISPPVDPKAAEADPRRVGPEEFWEVP